MVNGIMELMRDWYSLVYPIVDHFTRRIYDARLEPPIQIEVEPIPLDALPTSTFTQALSSEPGS